MTQPTRSLVVLMTGALVAVGTPVLAAPPEPSSTKDLAESRHTVREKGQRTEQVTSRLKRAKAELAELGERAEQAQKRYAEEAAALKRTRKAFVEARQQARTAAAKYENVRDEAARAEPSRGVEPSRAESVRQNVQDGGPQPENIHAEDTQSDEVQAAESETDDGEHSKREDSAEGGASQAAEYPDYKKYATYFADAMKTAEDAKAEASDVAEESEKTETAEAEKDGTEGAEDTRSETANTRVTGVSRNRATRFEELRTAHTKALSLRAEARRTYERQKEEFAAARKAKTKADAAYEEQESAVTRLRTLRKRLLAENDVVFLADRRASARDAGSARAVVSKAKGKNRRFARGAARGRLVVQSALKWIGTPYSWGGGNASGPSYGIGRGARTRGFDCSGLALYAWGQAGVKLGHYTGLQWNSGPRIPISMASPGDLVFFARNIKDPDTIHHVGIFIGRGRMVEAPYTGARVRISSIWRKGLIGAVRPA
ncbi:C40 family peptidase [Actinocorallia aurantiaca]|uniref:NlpC/P60 domain-containing protein n=1 Tax=Actinocorallia aurantiaca TaxID=46204 RepID=A0ABN3TYC8_9ACTN